jgi:hypothetical protein
MHRGYVKLWRKSLDSGLVQNAEAWQLMTWCLLKASHRPHKQLVGKQVVELKPGQLVFGRHAAAKELCSTERKIRTSLDLLKNMDFLTIKATSKYSVITIVNWDTYQQERPASDQQATSKRPASDQQTTTNKNDKNAKNEKTVKLHSPELCEFVRRFQSHALELHGNLAPKITDAATRKSEDTVNKLIRLDGFSLDDIKAAMRWAVKDDFWSANARSLAQLRKPGRNGLSKFQSIYAAWRKETGCGDDDVPIGDMKALRAEAIRLYGPGAG